MIYDFRMADNDDFGNIVSIFKRAIDNMNSQGIDQWDEYYPDTEILRSDIDKRQMHVVTGDGRIVSTVVVNEEQGEGYESAKWNCSTGKIAALHRLCVDPDFQHLGIGEITIRFIEEMLVKQGYSSARFDAFSKNPYALRLYKKLDYSQTGEVSYRKGVFYLYEKQLVGCGGISK